jgi:hypothetical protein
MQFLIMRKRRIEQNQIGGALSRYCALLAVAVLVSSVCLPFRAFADDSDVISPNGSDVDVLGPMPGQPAGGTLTPSYTGTNVPSNQAPQLSSLPSSPYKIYLDFTGATINSWAGFSPGTLTPYDQDGDPTTFSPSEIQSIDQIWARVAENYSPFNVDVTTIDPGNYGTNKAVRIVISGSGSWYGTPAGGISQVGSFHDTNINANTNGTVFVFPGWLANGTAKYVGIAASHEAGHAFGLVHQSTYNGNVKTAEYGPGTWPGDPNHPFSTPGTGYKSPIMGLGYYADRALWWYGQSSTSANIYQDDVSIISANVFGYRPINPNVSIGTALSFADTTGNIAAAGIIRKTTDQYYYSFTTPGGPANINMDVARFVDSNGSPSVIGMLDSKLQLFDSSGNLIMSAGTAAAPSNPILDASLSMSLSGGVYYVAAESIGNYGDIGQFTMNGSIVPPGPPVLGLSNPLNATIITGGTGTLGISIGNTAAPFNNSLNYSVSAALTSGTAALGTLTPASGTVAAGSSQFATIAATSTVIGSHIVGFLAADLGGSSGTQSASATLTVVDHAQPTLTASNPSQPVVIVGAQGVTSNLTLSNGSSGQANLAPLDVSATGTGVSGPVGGQVVASGLQQSYTGTLNTSALGPQNQTFKITAGDDHTLPGASPPSDLAAGVNFTVMDHANASFSATGAQTTATLNFGGLLQGAAVSPQSFTVYNVAANTTPALTSNLKLTGFSASGDNVLGTNLAAFGNLSAGSGNTFSATIDTSHMTTTGLNTVTMDATQLLDDSTLPGAGGNNNGTLTLVLAGTVGAAAADNSNSPSSFGPPLAAAVPQGGSYAGLKSQAVTTSGTGGGGLLAGTSATILAGSASTAANAQMAWRTGTAGPPGQADGVLSDVVKVSLPAVDSQTHNGTAHTDVYVMQLSYDPAAAAVRTGMSEQAAAEAGLIQLDYLDPGPDAMPYTNDDEWELAVEGNIGSLDRQFEGLGAWNGDTRLGDYGVDVNSHTVWAVVDHGGDFAVVPEPSAIALLATAAAVIMMYRARHIGGR